MRIRKKLKDPDREAKIVSIRDHVSLSPQIPEQPTIQSILHLHTLTGIDQLIEEHFRQTKGTNNSYL